MVRGEDDTEKKKEGRRKKAECGKETKGHDLLFCVWWLRIKK